MLLLFVLLARYYLRALPRINQCQGAPLSFCPTNGGANEAQPTDDADHVGVGINEDVPQVKRGHREGDKPPQQSISPLAVMEFGMGSGSGCGKASP